MQALEGKLVIGKLALLMNNIAKTLGVSQGIVTESGAPNLIPSDMNGESSLPFIANVTRR